MRIIIYGIFILIISEMFGTERVNKDIFLQIFINTWNNGNKHKTCFYKLMFLFFDKIQLVLFKSG